MKKFLLLFFIIFHIPVYSKNIIWDQKQIIKECINLNGDNLTINNTEVVFDNGCLNIYNGSLKINNSVLHGTYNRVQNKMINIERSTLTIRHAEFDLDHYISTSMSDVDIENLKSVDNNSNMFFFVNSGTNFFMSSSQIEGYKDALYFFGTRNIYLKNNFFKNNDTAVNINSSKLAEINYNDFEYNEVAINSNSMKTNAENNYFQGINKISGNFKINSFSSSSNILDKSCCSNIMFIPGIMSSRLYLDNNQLWEPNRNADVKKLFLDNFGNSLYNIYTKDIIDITNIFLSIPYIDKSLHKEFIDYLNRLKTNHYINDYKIIPYDWRLTDELNLVDQIISLSKTSKTGKVTIITHSNGGLIAKHIITELKRQNLSYMIDNIIFVAMPEYGTPQAITSLMYGHSQSILSGLILKSEIAKKLGVNMYTAYILLPSDKYLSYKKINSWFYPELNTYLLNKARDFHEKIDNLIYPENLSIYQIVGYGVDTVYDIKKQDDKYIPLYNKEGDGTVQDMKGFRFGTTTYIDLNNTDYLHANMMNSPDVISNINNILKQRDIRIFNGLNYNSIINAVHSNLIKIIYDSINLNISIKTDNDFLSIDNSDFIKTSTDNNSRFEVLDNQIYLFSKNINSLKLDSNKDELIDVEFIENNSNPSMSHKYENIPVYKNISESITLNNDKTLDLTFLESGKTVKFYDINSTTTKKDIITEIKLSSISRPIKDRYIRKIENNENLNKIKSYLKSVIENELIKRKYTYIRGEYLYLYTLLLKS